MEDQTKVSQYKIGDYARYMGVTPDLLKHYEQHGLVTPEVSPSGYRYYPFTQSPALLSSMGLRSYGLPLREISAMLREDDLDAYLGRLEARTQEIRRQMRHEQALLDEHERLVRWLRRVSPRGEDFQIDNGHEMLFLHHSQNLSFIDEPEVYDILGGWTAWLPVVKSCLRIDGEEKQWGLVIHRSFAEENDLPMSSAVRIMPARKRFVFSFSGYQAPEGVSLIDALEQRCRSRMAAMNLFPTGDMLMIMLLQTHEEGRSLSSGLFSVPID